ncbi:sugar kinase [Bengtsoniella intestinalis]|uniref:sugar kinase n=1 Tax=Bengtsoniella intestinalis TaxID=3073143 RepID=UPI00391FAD83
MSRQFRYDLVCPTSMGVRITPMNRQPAHTSDQFVMKATSAESNVLNVSASLGLRTMVMSKFVAESPVAWIIKADLRARNIGYEGAEVDQGGAWGYRHQFNIADGGFGMRGPRVWNDRSGEVGRTISMDEFDIERIFVKEGVNIIHLSGLFAALSPETSKFCVELARVAKANGTRISFDLNFRASFWKGREEELSAAFAEIASLADILIGNEEDFQLALGIQGPDAGGHEIGDKIESFKQMILRVQEKYPNATTYATTLRQVISANEHMWGAILYAGGEWYVEEPREIHVYDRIGGGDGFVSGLLYAILKGWDCDKWLQFGWASGALAATMDGDYATPVDEDQVFSIYKGNARVKR